MPVNIPQINAAADTFNVWLSKTNLVLNAISTVVMTVNSSAGGDITTGNGSVNGVFGATILVTPTLRGGNVTTTNVLTIVSNVTIGNSSMVTVGNSTINATMNSSLLTVGNINVGTLTATTGIFPAGITYSNSSLVPVSTIISTNTVSTVDSTLLSGVRSSEYLLLVKNNNANQYQISKLLMVQDGTVASITEYAIITTNGSIGVFSGTANSSAALLQFTPAVSNNVTIKGSRNSISVS